ncbi:MAG: tetratricopeptide repeat protein [candidate division NC10 bacterium]|nr:tetratricopeptide repeat protein [candidate division NC10 bacterium]
MSAAESGPAAVTAQASAPDAADLSGRPIGAVAVILVALATYVRTLGYDFAFDDRSVIPLAWQVGAGSPLDVLRAPVRAETVLLPYFRPLAALSYWLDGLLWQGNPGGFHLTNLLLHAVVSVLVLAVGRRLLPAGPAPLLGALLFAVHPVHVEPVAWIQGRVDLLSATGILLAVLLGVAGAEAAGRRRLLCWAAAAAAFLLALLAKEVAVVAPLLAALVLGGQPGREGWRRVRAGAPLLALMGATFLLYVGLRTLALGSPALGLSGGPPLADRALLAFRVIPLSLRLLVWPVGLNPTHVVAPPSGPLDPGLLLGVLLAALVAALASTWGRRVPGLGVGLVWLALAWLPVSNLLPIAGFAVAERYLYLPSAGLCLALAGAAAGALAAGVRWREARAPAVGVVLLTLGALAAVQAELWRDPRTFYEGLVRSNPGSPLAHNNLGEVYLLAGEDVRAEEAFLTAAHLRPADAAALSNLGLVAQRRGDFQEARRLYREALAARPEHAAAWNNLGTLYEAEGEWARAAAAYREAVRLAPVTPRYLGNLADALAAQGRREEAAVLLERAIALDPGGARWRTALRALRPDGRP